MQSHWNVLTSEDLIKAVLMASFLSCLCRVLCVPLDEVIAPGHQLVVPGEGMPKPGGANKVGILLVHVNANGVWPCYVPNENSWVRGITS
jgi:hypothetical protein